jgi:hypothetical protein
MKVILDLPDNKAPFFLEMIKNYPFVRAENIVTEKIQLLEEMREAIDNLNKVKKGILKPKPAKDLLNEI